MRGGKRLLCRCQAPVLPVLRLTVRSGQAYDPLRAINYSLPETLGRTAHAVLRGVPPAAARPVIVPTATSWDPWGRQGGARARAPPI